MERRGSLVALDREMCSYHLRNNYSKKDNLYCYQPQRGQIAHFYSSMAEHFYRNHIKSPTSSPRDARSLKTKSHTQQAIRDPTLACLPPSIPQDNLIDPGIPQLGMNTVPMFSEVEASKKQKYLIAREVRDLLGQDIRQMQDEKEEVAFRRRFPSRQTHKHPRQTQQESTEFLIKEFNRMLIKYKNNGLNMQAALPLLQKQNQLNFTPDGAAEQQFKILNLFKKLYMQTKSQDINQNLINYLLKFHHNDKITKKLRTKLLKPNNNKTTNVPTPKRASQHKNDPSESLKGSKASIRSKLNESKQSPTKSSHFKPEDNLQIKKRAFQLKDSKKARSRTTHQLKLKL